MYKQGGIEVLIQVIHAVLVFYVYIRTRACVCAVIFCVYAHFYKVFANEGDWVSFIPCFDLFVDTNIKSTHAIHIRFKLLKIVLRSTLW